MSTSIRSSSMIDSGEFWYKRAKNSFIKIDQKKQVMSQSEPESSSSSSPDWQEESEQSAIGYLSSIINRPEGTSLMNAQECDEYLLSNLAEIWS